RSGRLPRSLCSRPWSQPPRTGREPRESYIPLRGSASRKTYPRIMAGAYLKATCPARAPHGRLLDPIHVVCGRIRVSVVDLGPFYEGRGARKRPPGGHIIVNRKK